MLFISDLHLSSSNPKAIKKFFSFIEEKACDVHKLFILGDFFKYWIGLECLTEEESTILDKLLEFKKTGKEIYFLPGNKDFLISEEILSRYGCKLLPDPFILEVNDKKILLTHGDLLCTEDKSYQRYRKFVHHPYIKKLFLSFPKFLKKKIADYLGGRSSKLKIYSDVEEKEVNNWFQKYNVDIILHGHTHNPKTINHQYGKRMVLGAWDELTPQIAVLDNDLKLVAF